MKQLYDLWLSYHPIAQFMQCSVHGQLSQTPIMAQKTPLPILLPMAPWKLPHQHMALCPRTLHPPYHKGCTHIDILRVSNTFDNSNSPTTRPDRNASLMVYLPQLTQTTTTFCIGYSLAFAFLPHPLYIPLSARHLSYWRPLKPTILFPQNLLPTSNYYINFTYCDDHFLVITT